MSALVSWRREQLEELERLALADQGQRARPCAARRVLPSRLDLVGEQRLAPLQQLLEGADEVEEPGLQHLLARVVEVRAARCRAASRWRRGSGPSGAGRPPPPCSAGTRAGAAPAPRAGPRAPRRPAASVGSTGTSIFDLMWMSVAAITMNSPATSRFSSLHQVQVLHVLARDGGDGDVVDVDLVAADQVEQQVERALEHRQRGCAARPRAAWTRRPRDGHAAGSRRRAGAGVGSSATARRRVIGLGRRRSRRSTDLHRRAHLFHGGPRPPRARALRALAQDVPHRVGPRRELRPARVDLLPAARSRWSSEPALAVEAADAGACGSPAPPTPASPAARTPCAGRTPGRCRGCRDRCGACARGR